MAERVEILVEEEVFYIINCQGDASSRSEAVGWSTQLVIQGLYGALETSDGLRCEVVALMSCPSCNVMSWLLGEERWLAFTVYTVTYDAMRQIKYTFERDGTRQWWFIFGRNERGLDG